MSESLKPGDIPDEEWNAMFTEEQWAAHRKRAERERLRLAEIERMTTEAKPEDAYNAIRLMFSKVAELQKHPGKNSALEFRLNAAKEKVWKLINQDGLTDEERYAIFISEFPFINEIANEVDGVISAYNQRSRDGYRCRESHQDKVDFQRLVIAHKAEFNNIAELKNIQIFNPYFNLYGKGHTIRDWINEVLPGHLKRGRQKKKK